MQIKIGNKKIDADSPAFIIAEIGTNHNGDPRLAIEMIKEAAKAGADAVKLQVVDPDQSYVKGSLSYEIFKKAYLGIEAIKRLKNEAEDRGLVFFATAGDLVSLDVLLKLKLSLLKISSGCMTNLLLVRKAARAGLPLIVSTGMSYIQEVEEVVLELEKNGAKEIALLHCVSEYPARCDELNLNSIKTLQSLFPRYPVGFSDHTVGSHASMIAVAMGAKVIEKHFTLNKRFTGPEHHFSADPKELKQLVEEIRNVEKAMGSSLKRPTTAEKEIRTKMRRFLVFTKDMPKGSMVSEDNVGIKRLISGKGLAPSHYDAIIGKKVGAKVKVDQRVNLKLLK